MPPTKKDSLPSTIFEAKNSSSSVKFLNFKIITHHITKQAKDKAETGETYNSMVPNG